MAKVSKSQVALKYARALYEGAAEQGAVPKVSADLGALRDSLLSGASAIKSLSNPIWILPQKKAAIAAVSKKLGLHKLTKSFLDAVAEGGRFGALAQILDSFDAICDEKHNIVRVKVKTAKRLSPAQDKNLKAALEKKTGKRPEISYEVDPRILGGLVVGYAGLLLDDSLQGKLDRLETIMKGED